MNLLCRLENEEINSRIKATGDRKQVREKGTEREEKRSQTREGRKGSVGLGDLLGLDCLNKCVCCRLDRERNGTKDVLFKDRTQKTTKVSSHTRKRHSKVHALVENVFHVASICHHREVSFFFSIPDNVENKGDGE